MLDNLTGMTCESCNSNVYTYEENDRIIIECSYCGMSVEDLEDYIKLDDDSWLK